MWAGEDSTDGSAVADRSIENLSPEVTAMTRKPAPGWASPQNGKYPLAGVPGVLRLKDGLANRNGDCTLPHDKAFSIQIGWRLFRLSGASIMSDGKYHVALRCEDADMSSTFILLLIFRRAAQAGRRGQGIIKNIVYR